MKLFVINLYANEQNHCSVYHYINNSKYSIKNIQMLSNLLKQMTLIQNL